jgi:AcrR family transcriptional regulator
MRAGRAAIAKAAIQVFAQKGYAGASTREICAHAGLTKPVLYYHFRGKEHLYRELMIDSFGNYHKMLLSASQTRGSTRERLVRMVQADFRLSKEDSVRTMFVLRMVFSPGDQHPLFDYVGAMEEERRIIGEVIQAGIDAGTLQGNARDLATSLIGMQLIATLEFLFTGRPTLTRRRAEKCVDLLLQGCEVGRHPYRSV